MVRHPPGQVIFDWFRRLDELVIYYNSRRVVNYANSCELIAVLGQALANSLITDSKKEKVGLTISQSIAYTFAF